MAWENPGKASGSLRRNSEVLLGTMMSGLLLLSQPNPAEDSAEWNNEQLRKSLVHLLQNNPALIKWIKIGNLIYVV